MKRTLSGALAAAATALAAFCLTAGESAQAQSRADAKKTTLKQSHKSAGTNGKQNSRSTMTQQQARRNRDRTKLQAPWRDRNNRGDENRATPANPGVSPATPSRNASQKARTAPSRTGEQRYGVGHTWQKPSWSKGGSNKSGGKRK